MSYREEQLNREFNLATDSIWFAFTPSFYFDKEGVARFFETGEPIPELPRCEHE